MLKRHPKMVGVILKAAGQSANPSRAELEAYAGTLAVVIIRPQVGASRRASRLRAASSG